MRVNLNQLCVFYLAARHKSMTATAKLLYVSTPAVTMQIKKMESWLGFPVFDRGQGELCLTERGKELLEALEPMFSNLEGLNQYIKELVNMEEAELSLGSHHMPGNYFIPDLIAHLHEKYPNLKVRMELATQDRLLEKLLRRQLDLAIIIGEPPDSYKCVTEPLFGVELALVASPHNELGKIDSLPVRELANLPLILQQRGTGVRRAVLDFFNRHGIQPDIFLENLSSDVIKQFLQKTNAAAFIGRFIVHKELAEGVLHEIKISEESPVCRFRLAYLHRQYTPMKIRRFLSGIEDFSPKFQTLK